jgi:hypothetical protein
LGTPNCRFSLSFTQEEILKDPNPFISDVLYWEGKFHQNNVSYNTYNGMSYDGTLLDETTGIATAKHPFSAASKESLQIMLYAHAIAGSPQAARFLSPDNPSAAPNIAISIMTLKLKTYLQFNETYPGFGGFLPWYTGDSGMLIFILIRCSFVWELRAGNFWGAPLPVCLCLRSLAP